MHSRTYAYTDKCVHAEYAAAKETSRRIDGFTMDFVGDGAFNSIEDRVLRSRQMIRRGEPMLIHVGVEYPLEYPFEYPRSTRRGEPMLIHVGVEYPGVPVRVPSESSQG